MVDLLNKDECHREVQHVAKREETFYKTLEEELKDINYHQKNMLKRIEKQQAQNLITQVIT